MDMSTLYQAFADGKLDKRIYWQIMREKFLPMLEYQNLLQECSKDVAIEINKNDIVLNFNGVRIAFDYSQTFCRAEAILSMRGNPEQDDFDFMGRLLHPGDVILDIGGNVGVVSLLLLHDNPDIGEIYSFEPLPVTFEKMKKNLSLNGNPEKIHPVNIGMSNEIGSFDFYLPGADEAASMQPNMDAYYMRESVDGIYTGRKKMEKIVCQVSTLDDFTIQHRVSKVDFIKIDVEGNEYDVLLGGANVLSRYKPIVYVEMLRKHAARFGYHPNDTIAYMTSLGYGCFVLRDEKLVQFDFMDDNTRETNFFFIHKDKEILGE